MILQNHRIAAALMAVALLSAALATPAVAQQDETSGEDAPTDESPAGEDAGQDPVSPDGAPFEVSVIPSNEIVRPGDRFVVTVKATNNAIEGAGGFTLQLTVPPDAVTLTTATSSSTQVTASIEPGSVTWSGIRLAAGSDVALTANGTVTPAAVLSDRITLEASALGDGALLAQQTTDIRPAATVKREVDSSRERDGEVVTVSVSVTANTSLTGLAVIETLKATGVANVVLQPTQRADDAIASAGSVEWSIASVAAGESVTLGYKAVYPPTLNAGDLAAVTAGVVRDAVSDLSRAEAALEIGTPGLSITGFEVEDLSPSDPIKPGDIVRGTVVVENAGVDASEVTINVAVAGAEFRLVGQQTDWNKTEAVLTRPVQEFPRTQHGGGGQEFAYEIEIGQGLREDTPVEQTATVVLGEQIVSSRSVTTTIDTGRREGANIQLWFTLILLFVVLGFGGLLFVVNREAKPDVQVANFAVVTVIVAAILILAFGLDVETETTLTLLGTIAGYVLGQRSVEARQPAAAGEAKVAGGAVAGAEADAAETEGVASAASTALPAGGATEGEVGADSANTQDVDE